MCATSPIPVSSPFTKAATVSFAVSKSLPKLSSFCSIFSAIRFTKESKASSMASTIFAFAFSALSAFSFASCFSPLRGSTNFPMAASHISSATSASFPLISLLVSLSFALLSSLASSFSNTLSAITPWFLFSIMSTLLQYNV